MKLKEYEGKELFKKYKLAVPAGFIATTPEEVADGLYQLKGDEVVLKAQVLVGGRGKAGGIKICSKERAAEVAKKMLGTRIKGEPVLELLVEEKLKIDQEMYLSFTVSRAEKGLALLFSLEGGVDIEELAKRSPEKIARIFMTEFDDKAVYQDLKWLDYGKELFGIVRALHMLMIHEDAQLVEINPLVLSGGVLVAADSKVIIDDNSLYRHKDYARQKEFELTGLEAEARKSGLQYVELDGNIAIIGNGAGLVMATLDIIDHFGGKPANFLDVGGGASVEKMEKALDIALSKPVKGLFINVFGGITRCDDIAQGLVNYQKEKKMTVPMVVRLIGTNESEGRTILKENGISALDSMETGAKEIVELAKRRGE